MQKALASSRKESPRHPARIRPVPLVQRKSANGAGNYSGEGVILKGSAIIAKRRQENDYQRELMRKPSEMGQLLANRGSLSIVSELNIGKKLNGGVS